MTNGKGRFILYSSAAFVLYALMMTGGFVWATFKPVAPYEVFAWAFTAGFGGYLGKRLWQKGDKYQAGDGDIERGNR